MLFSFFSHIRAFAFIQRACPNKNSFHTEIYEQRENCHQQECGNTTRRNVKQNFWVTEFNIAQLMVTQSYSNSYISPSCKVTSKTVPSKVIEQINWTRFVKPTWQKCSPSWFLVNDYCLLQQRSSASYFISSSDMKEKCFVLQLIY